MFFCLSFLFHFIFHSLKKKLFDLYFSINLSFFLFSFFFLSGKKEACKPGTTKWSIKEGGGTDRKQSDQKLLTLPTHHTHVRTTPVKQTPTKTLLSRSLLSSQRPQSFLADSDRWDSKQDKWAVIYAGHPTDRCPTAKGA